jgi:tetratricopeptide (TPR) repeat protein/predicted aspartyl protease
MLNRIISPTLVRLAAIALTAFALHPSAALAASKCHIGKVADLPITMNNLRPVIPTKINGQEAKFILDSGAFYSMISSATASILKLKLQPGPWGMRMVGIGGSTDVQVANVKEFQIVGVTVKNVEFLVGGSEVGYAGLLGQNLLELFDVEYDLANGAIRLFKTEDCGHVGFAYWVKPDQTFSMMSIDRIEPRHPHTIGEAYLNGEKIRVMFDSGAYTSGLSLRAAAKAGIKPDSPGVVESGYTHGIGRGAVKTYVGTFGSFKIGDSEEIKNAKLRFADLGLEDVDMLVGADFFISHRIFVANKEHRLFLTYNGGPVFDLSKKMAVADADSGDAHNVAAALPDSMAPAAAEKVAAGAAPADAAELARRGSAQAARRDFAPALANLTKAIEMSPDDPEYYFQRANAYSANGQADLALADLDRVISLKQDFLPAYIPRAEIKLWKKDKPAAMADLDAADHLAPKAADLRFELGEVYEKNDRLPAAIEQYGLWIDNHPDDSRMVTAWANRCYSRMLQNQDLNDALSDCSRALRRADKTAKNYPYLIANRGFVRLRQGDYAKAIGDFNDALKMMSGNARALYGRAVAESRQNKKSESAADLAAAKAAEANITERFERHGIAP